MGRYDESSGSGIGGVAIGVVGVLALVGIFAAWPQYSVYSSRLAGEAELAQAEYSKKVLVQTAQAKLDAAGLEAQAEVKHAEGVSQANKIIADGLGGPDGYLRWKFIQTLRETAEHSGTQIIYVPTEANLPLTETTRLKK